MRNSRNSRLPLLITFGMGILTLTFVFMWIIIQDSGEESAPLADHGVMEDSLQELLPLTEKQAEAGDPEWQTGEEAKTSLSTETIDPESYLFRGRVVDRLHGSAVQAFTLYVYKAKADTRRRTWNPDMVPIQWKVSEGMFKVERPVEDGYLYQVRAQAHGYRTGRSEPLEVQPGKTSPFLRIELEPAPAVQGQALDGESFWPVKGTVVFSQTDAGINSGFDLDIKAIPHAETDDLGKFKLKLKSSGQHTLIARHPEYGEALATGVEPSKEAEILLRKGFTIQGTALDPQGNAADDAVILITGFRGGGNSELEHRVRTDAKGEFTSRLLHPGTYEVRIESMADYPVASNYFYPDSIEIKDRNVTDVQLGYESGTGSLIGIAKCGDEPVEGATVIWEFYKRSGFGISGKVEKINLAVTDSQGQFGLYNFEPTAYGFFLDISSRVIGRTKVFILPGQISRKTINVGVSRVKVCLIDSGTSKTVHGRNARCSLYLADNNWKIVSPQRNAIHPAGPGTFDIPYLKERHYILIFTAKGYGPAALKITPKKSIVLEETVVMRKGGVVHAEVQSTTELSTEDIEFRLPFESTWLSFPASGLKRDRAGRFILDRVGEGSMRLHCSCFGNKKQANLSVYRETPALAQFYFHPPILVKGQVRSGNRSLANVRVELSTRIIDEETGRNKTLQFSSRTDTQGKYSQEVTCPAQYEIALYSEHDLELAIHGATDAYIYDGPYLLDLQASLYRLEGFLKDFQTHEPIAGASVTFKSYVTYITQTDQDGHFIFPSLPKYNGALHISAPGYYQEPKINISPYIQGEGIALKVDLGEQGASLRLVLPKIWWVNLVETYKYDFHISSLRKLSLSDFQMQEDRWTWLIHGLPPGKRKITTNISHLKGINLEVELKEGETTELIIPSKQQ